MNATRKEPRWLDRVGWTVGPDAISPMTPSEWLWQFNGVRPGVNRMAESMTTEAFEREVKDRFNLVQGLYGDRLEDEQLEGVREGVEGIVAASQALRAVRLRNGDEPFWAFEPYRED